MLGTSNLGSWNGHWSGFLWISNCHIIMTSLPAGAASTSSADLSIANGYHLQPPKCHKAQPWVSVTWAGPRMHPLGRGLPGRSNAFFLHKEICDDKRNSFSSHFKTKTRQCHPLDLKSPWLWLACEYRHIFEISQPFAPKCTENLAHSSHLYNQNIQPFSKSCLCPFQVQIFQWESVLRIDKSHASNNIKS